MNPLVDIVLVVLALLAIAVGWRRGILFSAASLVGLGLGLWVGILLAPPVVAWTSSLGWTAPLATATVSFIVIVGCAGIISGVIATLAMMVRRLIGARGAGRTLDAVGGAVFGLLSWAVVVWLLAGFLQTTGLIAATNLVASSRVVAALNSVSPVPVNSALSNIDNALAGAGLPEVFSGGAETIRGTQPPDSTIPQAVNASAAGVVKILASEPKCGTDSEGSGWVAADGRVVTNAHVVAGSDEISVQPRGNGPAVTAKLVVFDPERDLAVLAVPGLNVAPLSLGSPLQEGDSAVVAGYPGNGSYTVSPARVRQTLNATGTDIYKQSSVTREIYSLRGTVRPGNSGGPLFDTDGKVVGVVFARSTEDPDTGYALTETELTPVLAQAASSSPVSSGACTTE
jgi:S1-C subfamily serine protease